MYVHVVSFMIFPNQYSVQDVFLLLFLCVCVPLGRQTRCVLYYSTYCQTNQTWKQRKTSVVFPARLPITTKQTSRPRPKTKSTKLLLQCRQTDRQTDGRTDRWMDRRMDGFIHILHSSPLQLNCIENLLNI